MILCSSLIIITDFHNFAILFRMLTQFSHPVVIETVLFCDHFLSRFGTLQKGFVKENCAVFCSNNGLKAVSLSVVKSMPAAFWYFENLWLRCFGFHRSYSSVASNDRNFQLTVKKLDTYEKLSLLRSQDIIVNPTKTTRQPEFSLIEVLRYM